MTDRFLDWLEKYIAMIGIVGLVLALLLSFLSFDHERGVIRDCVTHLCINAFGAEKAKCIAHCKEAGYTYLRLSDG